MVPDPDIPVPTNRSLRDLPRGLGFAVELPTSAGEWYRFAFSYKESADSLATPMLVDAENVRAIIDELHVLLDGASAQISEYMGSKNEM